MSNHVYGFLQHDFIDVIKRSCFEQELVDVAPNTAQLADDLTVLCGDQVSNVIKLTRKEPPTSGEVAHDSVTEMALRKKLPSQSPFSTDAPKGRAFYNALTK